MAKPIAGLINARAPKTPRPPASPKDFVWPEPERLANGLYQKFAASLQELLTAQGKTHNDMAKALYGEFDNGVPRTIKGRKWIVAEGTPPDATEAAYVAQYLNVPMARLLEPKAAFDPHPSMLIRRGRNGKKRKAKRAASEVVLTTPKKGAKVRRMNGHAARGEEVDPRWVLPHGIAAPQFKLETSQEHSQLVAFELRAQLPPQVAMAIMSMVEQHRLEPAPPAPAPVTD